MRVVVQRVSHASVSAARSVIGQIEGGMLVFVGIGPDDTDKEITQMVDKLVGLRIFSDGQGKMNRSLLDNKGEMLVVSQFTLWGNCYKGRRPSFVDAAPPEMAEPLYEQFVIEAAKRGIRVASGLFGADMQVTIVNDGPVTLVLESW
ncbi:MAG: D-tyrosyl-tRNA(Tyr) deacylase [Planctomycetaceae bacterium]|jgi:D-aminoacyl-tRNA deacylase|nr:D-tyrosyl-tRNA(Tyr) deacylase [Planctomycetaceae bacterium]